jgi:hypothetical protein
VKHLSRFLTPFVILASLATFSLAGFADDNDDVETFTIDVAQDGNSYVQNSVDPSASPNVFGRGDTGILDGTIYRGGTLPTGRSNNDPNAPGGIGKYRWTGTYTTGTEDFLKAIARLPGAPSVLATATETFMLSEENSIVTNGNWPNAFFTLYRAVAGGTGRYRYIVGETREVNLGENRTGFCNLRITFTIRTAKGSNGR